MSKIDNVLKEYSINFDDKEINNLSDKYKNLSEKYNNNTIKTKIINFINLTSLHQIDNQTNIDKWIDKINKIKNEYKKIPNVAAICVYPSLVKTVKEKLNDSNIKIAAVSGGFPNSQTFIEIKIAEAGLSILEGANEIDTVISVGKFLDKDYETVTEEIQQIKESCQNKAKLKVILETGVIKKYQEIYKASIIAMEAGADFIKTSTGKEEPAATPEAFIIMCKAIKDFYKATNKKIGIKAAGGIKNTNDAVLYYTITKEILGEEWCNNNLFRIGASKLLNKLLSDIYNKEINYL